MPDKKAIERGLAFEQYVADALGGKVQPGSGNKFFAPSDVLANGILLSCKSEINFTYAKLLKYHAESVVLAQGTGSIPALAFESDPMKENNNALVLWRLSDLAKAFSSGVSIPKHFESKGIEKRAKADVPIMLR